MQKIYLLLRNNKQTGPLSLEELNQQELKSSDLIWIEGQSAGWRNPQDINELKSYLPQAGENTPDKVETSIIQKPIEEKKASAPKRRSILSKKIFISLPAGVNNNAADEEPSQNNLEEKAQELYNKIQAYTNNKEAIKETNEPEIKYSRSLSDIKKEYAAWLTEQRNKKRNFPKKSIAIAAAALVLLTAGFFIFDLNRKDSPSPQQLVLQQATHMQNEVTDTEAGILPDNNTSNTPADAIVYNTANEENFVEKDLTLPVNNEPVTPPVITKENKVEDEYILKASPIEKEEKVIQPSIKKSIDNAGPQPKTKEEQKVPITKLISIRHKNLPGDKKGLEQQVITVQNNSDQLLKVVAVDVTYYDRSNKKVHTETIYFSNIEPNKSLTLTAPGHKKAFTADTQFGLISSEEGSLFFAKQ